MTFAVVYVIFRRSIREAASFTEAHAKERVASLDRNQKIVLGALGAVVLAYPAVSWFGGPVWAVAACGALLLLALASRLGHEPADVVRREVHFDVLLFLLAVLVLSIGLRNVGLVDRLAQLYAGASPMKIGAISALGSAMLNNHPMGHLNMMALQGSGHTGVLAALIGGDLGPRLFPMGSLAGLLWLEMLRRSSVEISVGRFVLIGAAATLPTLAVCLSLL